MTLAEMMNEINALGRNIRAAGAEKAVNRVYVLGYQFRVIGH